MMSCGAQFLFIMICSSYLLRDGNAYATRSYDLEVPGSKPIRIIEADPVWDHQTRTPQQSVQFNPNDRNDRNSERLYKHQTHRGDRDDRFNRPDFEHRTLRPDIITDRNDHVSDEEFEDNSEKLKKFLDQYAQNVVRKPDNNGSAKDELQLSDKFDDYDDSTDAVLQKPEKSKSWNLLHFDKIQNNPPDEKGWVSMEAVPWSVSKISKWHGKPKKDKYQNAAATYYEQQNSRPYTDRFHTQSQHQQQQSNDYPRPNYPKPIRPLHLNTNNRPAASGYYDDVDEDFDDNNDEDFYNKRPTFSRPTATYGHKVNLHTVQTFGVNGGNKRPIKHDANCNHNNHHQYGFNHHHHDDGGIITDGLPANFPDHEYGNRRRGVANEPQSTATHPFKGDVLPPLDDGAVNMTTSHGGLLQVDASFETVDQAQRAHSKRQKLKTRAQQQRRPVKVKPQSGNLVLPQRLQSLQSQQQHVQYDNVGEASSVSDSNAVLAAVGAGMIPAGMALLVPMAMSGKRRRRQIEYYPDFVVTSPYTESVELTLPSTL